MLWNFDDRHRCWILFWPKQWRNRSSIFCLGIAEAQEIFWRTTLSAFWWSIERLAICELQQSKTRPVTESAFLADYTFLYKTGFFGEISSWHPQILRIQKTSPTNSAFCWLPIWLILTYGLAAMDFWSQVTVLNWFWTDWCRNGILRFRGLRWVRLTRVSEQIWEDSKSAFWRLLKHIFLITIATVTAI
jgi:hypothetical protein